MCSLVQRTKKKTGVHCLSSMARVIGFHYGQTESWQCQTHQGVTTSIIIFPPKQQNSMGPEMGLHLEPREPPFLWKRPLFCFNHYTDALFVCLCFYQWMYFYDVTSRWVLRVHECMSITCGHLHLSLCVCVCEVGAATMLPQTGRAQLCC